MNFICQLFNPDEAAVDSIIVGGVFALVAMLAMSIWQVGEVPGAFNAMSFGTGCAAILGSIGAGKRIRDGTSNGSGN